MINLEKFLVVDGGTKPPDQASEKKLIMKNLKEGDLHEKTRASIFKTMG